MANTNNPYGLRAIRHRNGAPYSGSGSLYHKAAADASIIAPGDPVVVTGEADSTGIATVTLATAGVGNALTGSMIGRTNGESTLLQDSGLNSGANTDDYILVEDDPDVVFSIQASGALAAGNISDNVDLLAGVAVEGKSKFQADSTTFGTGATKQLKVLRRVREENNELDTNGKIEVMINNHTQSAGIVGV